MSSILPVSAACFRTPRTYLESPAHTARSRGGAVSGSPEATFAPNARQSVTSLDRKTDVKSIPRSASSASGVPIRARARASFAVRNAPNSRDIAARRTTSAAPERARSITSASTAISGRLLSRRRLISRLASSASASGAPAALGTSGVIHRRSVPTSMPTGADLVMGRPLKRRALSNGARTDTRAPEHSVSRGPHRRPTRRSAPGSPPRRSSARARPGRRGASPSRARAAARGPRASSPPPRARRRWPRCCRGCRRCR